MKYFLSLIVLLFIATYSYAAFPIHLKERPVEKQSVLIEKNDHPNTLEMNKAMPHPMGTDHAFAVASLVFGILGIFFLHILFGILAIVFGVISFRRHPFRRPFALIGFILGIVDLFL